MSGRHTKCAFEAAIERHLTTTGGYVHGDGGPVHIRREDAPPPEGTNPP